MQSSEAWAPTELVAQNFIFFFISHDDYNIRLRWSFDCLRLIWIRSKFRGKNAISKLVKSKGIPNSKPSFCVNGLTPLCALTSSTSTVFLLLLWIAGSNVKHARLPCIRRVVCACVSLVCSHKYLLGPLRSRAAKAIGFIDMMIDYSLVNAPLQKELSAGKLWTTQNWSTFDCTVI